VVGVEEKVVVVAPHKKFFFFLGLEVGGYRFFLFFSFFSLAPKIGQ